MMRELAVRLHWARRQLVDGGARAGRTAPVRLRTRSSRGGGTSASYVLRRGLGAAAGDRERALDVGDLAPTWHGQLERWLARRPPPVSRSRRAMVLATADEGRRSLGADRTAEGLSAGDSPSIRSRFAKGTGHSRQPRAAIVFPVVRDRTPGGCHRVVEPVEADAADAYFASRAYRFADQRTREPPVSRDPRPRLARGCVR